MRRGRETQLYSRYLYIKFPHSVYLFTLRATVIAEISRSELLERVKSLEATLAQTALEALKEQRHLIATMTGEYSSGASAVHSSLLIKSADSPKSGHVRVPSLLGHQSEGSGSNSSASMVIIIFMLTRT